MVWRGVALLLALFLLSLPAPAAAQLLPPDIRWQAFQTDHFNVTFAPGLEPFARRAAERAEWAHALLSRRLLEPPPGRVELVVTDNIDLSNGYATPFPRNRIVLYAYAPAGEPTLAHHDDWLQLIVLHELVHIFHLDQAGGVWEPLRRLFGRDPVLFPQIFSPGWVVEGLATWLETSFTTAGRARSSVFEMMVRAAILEGEFFEIDQATLDPVAWPAGHTRYLYGSMFIDHLARQYGGDAVEAYLERIGSQTIPYRQEAAARRAFGTTFAREWQAWQDSLRTRYTTLADSLAAVGVTVPEVLTREGRDAHSPRFSPDGSRIVYTAGTGREDPAHRLLSPSGVLLADRERTIPGAASWLPDGSAIVFPQLEFEDAYHVRSDLYVDDFNGAPRRLTEGGRLAEPDVHPSGQSAVAVAAVDGTNVLVVVDLASGDVRRLTEASFDTYWTTPRWSPDGTWIAAARWGAGGRFDIVVVDTDGRDVVRVTDDPSLDIDPAWSPDGRYLLFSSDRTGIPNLFAYDMQAERVWQVTNVLTGAFQPDVASDGSAILFSYYQADGHHVARIPFDPAGWRAAPAPSGSVGRGFEPGEAAGSADSPAEPYSIFPTVLPTRWSPAFTEGEDFGLGLSIGGQDVVERHIWAVRGLVLPDDLRIEGAAAYRYRGWGMPVLDFQAEQEWVTLDLVSPGEVQERRRESAAAVSWIGRSWRLNQWVQGGLDVTDIDYFPAEDTDYSRTVPVDVGASVSAGLSSVRSFGLSLGPQEGATASARLQGRHYLSEPESTGLGRSYWRLTGRTRGYRAFDWFGFAPPTLALRLDGGVQADAAASGFTLGGAGGMSSGLLVDSWLGASTAAYPLRGVGVGIQRGSRVVSATAEYRFPILLVERGIGLFPLAIDRLWGDVFMDAGAAWCPRPCNLAFGTPIASPQPIYSAGAEAVLELRLGYVGTLPLRFGFAVPFGADVASKPVGYLRVGPSF